MYIDKFTVLIKDIHTKKSKRVKIDADTPVDAHLRALPFCNELTQDIIKITNAENEVVYTLTNGFANV